MKFCKKIVIQIYVYFVFRQIMSLKDEIMINKMNNCLLLFVLQSDGLDLVINGIGEFEMNDNFEGFFFSFLEVE